MFSIMYSGAFIAYRIIYRQNTTLLDWMNIFSSEMVVKSAEHIYSLKVPPELTDDNKIVECFKRLYIKPHIIL